MAEASKRSDQFTTLPEQASHPRRRRDFSDAIVAAGIVAMVAGAWLFHPGAGVILLGFALIVIGTRG